VKVLGQGRMELSFKGERETTKGLEREMEGLGEVGSLFLW
jgi:hypothetical protein